MKQWRSALFALYMKFQSDIILSYQYLQAGGEYEPSTIFSCYQRLLYSALRITIYAECSPNNSGVNGHFYALELYFSANEFPVRDHIIGITFGTNRMERNQIDTEIDSWVEQTITNETFPELLESYIRKEGMWENYLNDEENVAE